MLNKLGAIEDQRQGIWLWIAFFPFLVCGYSLIFQLLIIRRWPNTKGQKMQLGLDKFGASNTLIEQ